MRTIIVDDEPLALEGLKLRLQQCADVEVVAECRNGQDAISAARQLQPDVMFLDLEMPGLSGFEVVQAIQADVMPLIVFVTAYEKFAVTAFELHAIDYILKPATLERIQLSLDRVATHLKNNEAAAHKQKLLQMLGKLTNTEPEDLEEALTQNTIAAKVEHNDCLAIKQTGKATRMVPFSEIRWIDAAGDYMCVHTRQETHVMRSTLKKLECRLNKHFLRVHKSTIVNAHCISEILPHTNGESTLLLDDATQLKVSRHYRDSVHEFLQSKRP